MHEHYAPKRGDTTLKSINVLKIRKCISFGMRYHFDQEN